MDYRPLGNTGLNVSEISFGCGKHVSVLDEAHNRLLK